MVRSCSSALPLSQAENETTPQKGALSGSSSVWASTYLQDARGAMFQQISPQNQQPPGEVPETERLIFSVKNEIFIYTIRRKIAIVQAKRVLQLFRCLIPDKNFV